MRSFARTSLALAGLALVVPSSARAQAPAADAPAGYRAVAPAPAPAAAPHAHRHRTLCAKCMKAQEARMTPPARIVACAHSKNGVCTACAALLAMPGEVTMGSPAMAAAPAEAPGRAVASAGQAPSAGSPHMAAQTNPGVAMAYDPSGGAEPAPIGVIQANYAQNGPAGMPAAGGMDMHASQPGRAMVTKGMDAGPGPAPFQPKSGPFPHPRIIGHLFGLTGIGSEYREEKAARKKETHAMISYDTAGSTVNELPASVVYGRR